MARYLHYRDVKKEAWQAGIFINWAAAAAPTVRPDSVGALASGDMYWDTVQNLLFCYNGSSWVSIGNSGVGTLGSVYTNGNTLNVTGSRAITITDADTDGTNTISISKTGAGSTSANLIALSTTTTFNGDFLDITMTNADTAARGIKILGQAAQRVTSALLQVTESGTGAVPTVSIIGNGVTTGALLSITNTAAVAPVAGTNGMVTVDMTTAAVATQGLLLIGPAAGRTGGVIAITDAGTSSGPLLDLSTSSTSSAKLIKFTTSGAITGSFLNVDMTNAGVAAAAAIIKGQAAVRTTQALVDISEQGTGAQATLRVTGDAATTGPLLALTASAAVAPVANTNGIQTINMTNGAAATQGLLIIGHATHTGSMLRLKDDGSTTGSAISIANSTTSSASIIKYTTSGAITGKVLDIDMTNAGVAAVGINLKGQAAIRTTGAIFAISEQGTGAVATASISGDAATTGPLLSLVATAAVAPVAGTNGMATIAMANAADATQGLLIINSTTSRTGALLALKDAGTSTGSCLAISQSGANSGNTVAITYSGAATGNAISVALANGGAAQIGLNISQASAHITSQAIKVTSLVTSTASSIQLTTHGVGASGVGAAVDVGGAADLVAGADLIRINSTGSPSSTSNILAVRQATGAGSAGAFAVYISATGTNVEALKVDDGVVQIDESLTVGLNMFNTPASTRSGVGAVPITAAVCKLTTTGGAQALTLADGTDGQHLYIIHDVDGGSAVLTPTTKSGFSTITFTNVGETCHLIFTTTRGWVCVGLFLAVAA